MPGLMLSLPRFFNNKAVGNCESRRKAIGILISYICKTLGIHYNDLGSYKELLDLIEAKAWRVNELVILTIHHARVTK
jgi:hypothetical protein